MIEVGLFIILGFKGNLNNLVSGKDEPSSVVFVTDINLIYKPPFGNDSFILTCNNLDSIFFITNHIYLHFNITGAKGFGFATFSLNECLDNTSFFLSRTSSHISLAISKVK